MEPQTSGPSVCDNAIFKKMCQDDNGHHHNTGHTSSQGEKLSLDHLQVSPSCGAEGDYFHG